MLITSLWRVSLITLSSQVGMPSLKRITLPNAFYYRDDFRIKGSPRPSFPYLKALAFKLGYTSLAVQIVAFSVVRLSSSTQSLYA